MFKLEVGQPFELFYGRNMYGQTGCILELLTGGSYCLNIYLNNMEDEEKQVLKQNRIYVRVIRELDFVLTLFGYANTSMVFEMFFDPTLYKDERVNDFLQSNMLLIVGIESNDGTIQTLRQISLPFKLFGLWNDAWNNSKKQDNYSQKYKRWVEDLDKRYSIFELWKMGKEMGYLGQMDRI